MTKVGFVGWRGMVGSVLMQRMLEMGDFSRIDPVFFSSSQVGQAVPSDILGDKPTQATLRDAYDLDALRKWILS